MAGDIGGARRTEVKHRFGVGGRLRSAEIADEQAPNVFRQRYTHITGPLARPALDLRVKRDLGACHHDGTIITQGDCPGRNTRLPLVAPDRRIVGSKLVPAVE